MGLTSDAGAWWIIARGKARPAPPWFMSGDLRRAQRWSRSEGPH